MESRGNETPLTENKAMKMKLYSDVSVEIRFSSTTTTWMEIKKLWPSLSRQVNIQDQEVQLPKVGRSADASHDNPWITWTNMCTTRGPC